MIKLILVLLLFFLTVNANGQNLNAKRYVKTDSFKCEFFVSDKVIKDFFIRDSLIYFWCKAQKIFDTQGGYSGKLIDGKFNKFYHSGQLAEQGFFKRGLKDGEWKIWHPNGLLKQVSTYKEGKINGRLVKFDEAGNVTAEQKYKRGKLKSKNSRQEEIQEKGSLEKTGEENQEKQEKVKFSQRIKTMLRSQIPAKGKAKE